jgi:uncharacterized membrane protein (UPF0127 family)
MKDYEVAVMLAAAILLICVFYFIFAKGERRRVTIENPDGRELGLDVELANTTATRMKGLMGRGSLGESEGMLFVFDKQGTYPFWMMNTTIALDAIYIGEDGRVVEVIGMEPCGLNILNCPTYTPKAQAKYVLEVNKGFAESHNIVVGKSRMISGFS